MVMEVAIKRYVVDALRELHISRYNINQREEAVKNRQ